MILKPIEGFSSHIEKSPELVISLFGIQGAGKTRFVATAPGPIGIIPLDRKTRFTIAKTMEEWGRKDVYMPKEDFIRVENPLRLAAMNIEQAKAYYKDHVHRILDAAYRLLNHPDIRTISIDSGSQLWEDLLFKHFGRNQRIMPRDRGPVNQDMIDFINAMSAKHLILVHKAAEIWIGDGDNAKPTGKHRAAGFPHIGFHCSVQIEMKKNILWDERNGSGGGKPWKYSMDIHDCQMRPELEGPQGRDLLTDDAISFESLALSIDPEWKPQ